MIDGNKPTQSDVAVLGWASVASLAGFFPYLASYAAALLGMSLPNKLVRTGVALMVIAWFSYLVTSRPPLAGVDAGFGTDILLYQSAFIAISQLPWFDVGGVLEVALRETGSGDVLFWTLAAFLVHLLHDPLYVWYAISFISLALIWYALDELSPRHSLLLLLVYCSTISFFFFQGAAIRQGLSTGFVMLALVGYLHLSTKRAVVFGALAAAAHSSGVLAMAIIFAGMVFDRGYVKPGTFGTVSVVVIAALALFALYGAEGAVGGAYIEQKIELQLKLETVENTWKLQLAVEYAAFMLALYYFRALFRPSFFVIMVLFLLVTLALMPMEHIGQRFFREGYFFYLFAYAVVLKNAPRHSAIAVTLLGAFAVVWPIFLMNGRYQGFFLDGSTGADFFFFNLFGF